MKSRLRMLVLCHTWPNPWEPMRDPSVPLLSISLSEQVDIRAVIPVAWTKKISRSRSGSNSCSMPFNCEYPTWWYPPKCLRHLHGESMWWSIKSRMRRLVKEYSPDVIYAPWTYPDGYAALKLKEELGLPVVIKARGTDILGLPFNPTVIAPTTKVVRKADAVVAVSQNLADHLVSLGAKPENVHVVYNGVDTERFVPRGKADAKADLGWDDTPTILFVGNLVPVKQVHVLLAACKQLDDAGLLFRCRIVGNGPLRSQLEKIVQRERLTKHIVFHGAIEHATLPTWFQAADLVCLPSRSEGVPSVLLEAMACGTPFVASNVGGIPEIATSSTDYLVESGNAFELAQAIAVVLNESTMVDQTGPRWRNWQESANELADIIRGAAAKS